MKHEDHHGNVQKSDGPNNVQAHNVDSESQPMAQQAADVRNKDRQKRSSTPWLLGLIAVVLVGAVAMWMGHVSTSLADTQQMVANNGKSLNAMSHQLSGMQAQLAAIGQQVNQLQTEIQNDFTLAMNYLLAHKTH